MKIGIFTDAYYPDLNGVVTSIRTLEKEMKKRGHEVYIFSPSKHEPAEDENLYMLGSMPLFIAKKFDYRLATFYSRKVANEIKELNLDVVHTQSEFSLGLFGKIISHKFDIPFIHTYHTMWEDYVHYIMPVKGTRNIYPKRWARTFSKSFMRKAECVIAPSKKTEKYLRYKCNVKNKPIFVIPTGIDIVPFNPSNFSKEFKTNLKQSLGIKEDEKVILFLGRVGEEKSIDKLMSIMPEVFKKLPKSKFLIVGDGPFLDNLKEQAKELNILDKVIFNGAVQMDEVPKYYSIADIFVNASTSETQGLTYMEAMASGVPVVASYAPNLREFIHDSENGFLVKRISLLPTEIIKVLTNAKLRDKFIANGLRTAKENSSEVFGEKIEKVYTQVIESYKMKKEETNKYKRKRKERISIFGLKLSLFHIGFKNKKEVKK